MVVTAHRHRHLAATTARFQARLRILPAHHIQKGASTDVPLASCRGAIPGTYSFVLFPDRSHSCGDVPIPKTFVAIHESALGFIADSPTRIDIAWHFVLNSRLSFFCGPARRSSVRATDALVGGVALLAFVAEELIV